VLVGKNGRRVRVWVGVRVGVTVTVNEEVSVGARVKDGMAADEVIVGVREGVGVKTSLANSALVNALSVLIVAVGEPPPVFGMTRSEAYKTLFPLLVLAIGKTTPMMQAANTTRRTIKFRPFI